MMYRTDTAKYMTVSHDSLLSPSATQLVVNCNENNAFVAITNAATHSILGTGTVSGGTVTIALSSLSGIDSLTVCATAYNRVPYLGTVIIQAVSVGGTLSSSNSICEGSSTGTMTLSGYTGNIVKWQRSNDGGNTWIDIACTTNTYSETLGTSGSYLYRVVVQNGTASPANSGTITITVDPATVAGTLSGGSSSICSGNNSGVMTLSGYTGSIVKWQKRVDGGTWNDISSTSATYSETINSAGNWEYRAVVQSGVCNQLNSNSVTISATQGSTGGSISGGNDICSSGSTGNMTLSGYTGSILKWQYNINGGNWSDINNTTTTYNENLNTAGTYSYRAIIQNGSCPEAYSAEETVVVYESTIAGIVTANNDTICAGNSSGNIILSGYNGTISKWQKRVDYGSWADISYTGSSYSETIMTSGLWEFRAVVNNNICPSENSGDDSIVVLESPVASFSWTDNGGTIIFSNTSTNANSFIWDFGDGSATSYDVNPAHNYANSGNYTVSLTATNGYCNDTESQTIDITTGVNDMIAAPDFFMWPNPASDEIRLLWPGMQNSNVVVQLFDETGRLIFDMQLFIPIDQQSISIKLHGIHAGCYTLTASTDKKSYSKMLLIR